MVHGSNLNWNRCIRLHLLWVNSYANERKCKLWRYDESAYCLYTAAPSPQWKIRKGGGCTQDFDLGHTLLYSSIVGVTTVRLHTTFPLWKYLTLANCSSKNFCPWTLFLDFHSNTTLMNDMEIFWSFNDSRSQRCCDTGCSDTPTVKANSLTWCNSCCFCSLLQ